jgi:hypothetical protein
MDGKHVRIIRIHNNSAYRFTLGKIYDARIDGTQGNMIDDRGNKCSAAVFNKSFWFILNDHAVTQQQIDTIFNQSDERVTPEVLRREITKLIQPIQGNRYIRLQKLGNGLTLGKIYRAQNGSVVDDNGSSINIGVACTSYWYPLPDHLSVSQDEVFSIIRVGQDLHGQHLQSDRLYHYLDLNLNKSTLKPPQETPTMSRTSSVTVEANVTLINNTKAESYSDDQLLDFIRDLENKIEGLKQIKAKSNKITSLIKKHQDTIDALVKELDSRDSE